MNNKKLAAICALSLTALTGCGSSSTPTAAAPTFADLDLAASTMQAKYTDANGDLTVPRASELDINAAPNATYTGYVSGDDAGDTLVGNLTVNADFGAGTATNTATGFIHETDGDYAGILTGGGTILANAPAGVPQISTSLTGDLTDGGGVIYNMDIALDGDFVADGGDPVGAMAGEATFQINGGLPSPGTFAAEK